uniref:FAD-binding oxidoreductase n=1 Tax=Gongylonema pulchrum TaxID=637853 RepID=A0A183DBL3_9BILA
LTTLSKRAPDRVDFVVGQFNQHGGKAIFPTIPKFTYGEQVEISLPDEHMVGLRALNYTFVPSNDLLL